MVHLYVTIFRSMLSASLSESLGDAGTQSFLGLRIYGHFNVRVYGHFYTISMENKCLSR